MQRSPLEITQPSIDAGIQVVFHMYNCLCFPRLSTNMITLGESKFMASMPRNNNKKAPGSQRVAAKVARCLTAIIPEPQP